MTRRRAARRIPEYVIGATITRIVLAAAWLRATFLEAIRERPFDLRLKWSGSRVPGQDVAMDSDAIQQFRTPPGSAEG
jgi:hypothetical protein